MPPKRVRIPSTTRKTNIDKAKPAATPTKKKATRASGGGQQEGTLQRRRGRPTTLEAAESDNDHEAEGDQDQDDDDEAGSVDEHRNNNSGEGEEGASSSSSGGGEEEEDGSGSDDASSNDTDGDEEEEEEEEEEESSDDSEGGEEIQEEESQWESHAHLLLPGEGGGGGGGDDDDDDVVVLERKPSGRGGHKGGGGVTSPSKKKKKAKESAASTKTATATTRSSSSKTKRSITKKRDRKEDKKSGKNERKNEEKGEKKKKRKEAKKEKKKENKKEKKPSSSSSSSSPKRAKVVKKDDNPKTQTTTTTSSVKKEKIKTVAIATTTTATSTTRSAGNNTATGTIGGGGGGASGGDRQPCAGDIVIFREEPRLGIVVRSPFLCPTQQETIRQGQRQYERRYGVKVDQLRRQKLMKKKQQRRAPQTGGKRKRNNNSGSEVLVGDASESSSPSSSGESSSDDDGGDDDLDDEELNERRGSGGMMIAAATTSTNNKKQQQQQQNRGRPPPPPQKKKIPYFPQRKTFRKVIVAPLTHNGSVNPQLPKQFDPVDVTVYLGPRKMGDVSEFKLTSSQRKNLGELWKKWKVAKKEERGGGGGGDENEAKDDDDDDEAEIEFCHQETCYVCKSDKGEILLCDSCINTVHKECWIGYKQPLDILNSEVFYCHECERKAGEHAPQSQFMAVHLQFEEFIVALLKLDEDKFSKNFTSPVCIAFPNVGSAYAETIKKPMDLLTIEKKVVLKYYQSLDAIMCDVRKMVANCKLFNQKDDKPLCRDADAFLQDAIKIQIKVAKEMKKQRLVPALLFPAGQWRLQSQGGGSGGAKTPTNFHPDNVNLEYFANLITELNVSPNHKGNSALRVSGSVAGGSGLLGLKIKCPSPIIFPPSAKCESTLRSSSGGGRSSYTLGGGGAASHRAPFRLYLFIRDPAPWFEIWYCIVNRSETTSFSSFPSCSSRRIDLDQRPAGVTMKLFDIANPPLVNGLGQVTVYAHTRYNPDKDPRWESSTQWQAYCAELGEKGRKRVGNCKKNIKREKDASESMLEENDGETDENDDDADDDPRRYLFDNSADKHDTFTIISGTGLVLSASSLNSSNRNRSSQLDNDDDDDKDDDINTTDFGCGGGDTDHGGGSDAGGGGGGGVMNETQSALEELEDDIAQEKKKQKSGDKKKEGGVVGARKRSIRHVHNATPPMQLGASATAGGGGASPRPTRPNNTNNANNVSAIASSPARPPQPPLKLNLHLDLPLLLQDFVYRCSSTQPRYTSAQKELMTYVCDVIGVMTRQARNLVGNALPFGDHHHNSISGGGHLGGHHHHHHFSHSGSTGTDSSGGHQLTTTGDVSSHGHSYHSTVHDADPEHVIADGYHELLRLFKIELYQLKQQEQQQQQQRNSNNSSNNNKIIIKAKNGANNSDGGDDDDGGELDSVEHRAAFTRVLVTLMGGEVKDTNTTTTTTTTTSTTTTGSSSGFSSSTNSSHMTPRIQSFIQFIVHHQRHALYEDVAYTLRSFWTYLYCNRRMLQ